MLLPSFWVGSSAISSTKNAEVLASSGTSPKILRPAKRATRPTVFPTTNATARSVTITNFCLFETFLALLAFFLGIDDALPLSVAVVTSTFSTTTDSSSSSANPGRPISCIRFNSSRLTIPCVTAPMTLRVGQGLVICFRVGHSAPVILVEYSKSFEAVSRLRTLEDWSFSKIESQPPPAPPPPEICPPFSNASAPRPSRGPPFHDQYTPDLEQRGS
mmetsp:Transcript_7243/g.11452  ORF Transcript_7243/g.11452 Transcript_7243/m.11452 type:complete len:217 (-) Transcript_7243:1040-1690(-)